ncbi:unnamed protein product [Cladocopium goreaui]|uniref:Uncharacterized protein n=1 Tax=Cladocopium goreaui TaxID=2562237 RepID=A0A9P1CM97_9DINO|nr:unnamed protein product [Cladocopium goreaui]
MDVSRDGQVGHSKMDVSRDGKADVKATARSAEDHEIFCLRNEVHLLRREVAWLQQEDGAPQGLSTAARPEPMRFGMHAPRLVRDKDVTGDKATEKVEEKVPPTKEEIVVALKNERECLKQEAQQLRQSRAPGASSPSKKGGDQLVDPKKPDGSRAAPTEESENTADKATPSKQEAAPRNMTPTRSEAKKSDLTEKSSAVRDISRSKTPSRSTAKNGATEKPAPVGKDASRSTSGRPAKIVASSEPPSRGGTSRSATPRLKFTPAERKVESPNKRRTPSPDPKKGRIDSAAQAWKTLAKAATVKPIQATSARKFQQEKLRRAKSPTPKQRSVSPVGTPKRSTSPKSPAKVSPRGASPAKKRGMTMKVALTSGTPQIFDRLHKDHAHRMWVLEERQVLAQETEQRVAKALQGRTVTVGSAAEVRAAGHRLYDEALRSRERLEAKRRQQRDAEALEDLQRETWCGMDKKKRLF